MDYYRRAGVNYETLDAFKALGMRKAKDTHGWKSARLTPTEPGQSATVVTLGDTSLAFVIECLGTKVLIALEALRYHGANRFKEIGQDLVACIANDITGVGAMPMVLNPYVAGSPTAWSDQEWQTSLLEGWSNACRQAGAVWGGGESASLENVVADGALDLAGAGIGTFDTTLGPLLGDAVRPGDQVVLVSSSGLHANGASLARAIASNLPDGLDTKMDSGLPIWEGLLQPSIIYHPLFQRIVDRGLPVTYCAPITGHGLLKIIRDKIPFLVRLNMIPEPPEVLKFIVSAGGLSVHDAYSVFNMGIGMGIYCRDGVAQEICALAEQAGMQAIAGGEVFDGPPGVELVPYGITL